MLQGALVKFDKTIFLRKNCYRNGLVMYTKRVTKNKYGLSINDPFLFILGLL